MNNYVVLTSGPSVPHTRGRQLADSPSSLRRKQASAGRLINKEGSVPVRSRHPRCRSLTSCPPAFRTRSLRAPHPHPPGAAESIAEQFLSTGRGPGALGASADRRLPGGELRARAARRCRGSAARVPVGAHSRAPAGRPHAGTPRPLAAVAAGRRAGSRGCAPAAAACFATAAEDLPRGPLCWPGRRPPNAPDPAAGTFLGRPHPLPRALSLGSTGIWGRRDCPRPPPSSRLGASGGGRGRRAEARGSLAPTPRASFIL